MEEERGGQLARGGERVWSGVVMTEGGEERRWWSVGWGDGGEGEGRMGVNCREWASTDYSRRNMMVGRWVGLVSGGDDRL